MSLNNQQLLLLALNASLQGAREILKVYNTTFEVEHKADNSPLTLADKNANAAIIEELKPSGLPVLSEEGRSIPYKERKNWQKYWIVDPLDGTKEFVKRNGEFTVNIALMEGDKPIAGVIYVPEKQWLYFSTANPLGAYKITWPLQKVIASVDAVVQEAEKLPGELPGTFTAVGSRSHKSEETEAYFSRLREKHGEIDVVSMGSSLKICLVAEGRAHVYPRFAPTMEWDVAAGHAIARGAGKELYDYKTGEPMRYNRQSLLNNWFIVE